MAKRDLKLEYNSLFDAMQEAYRDCDEQKKAILSKIQEATSRKTASSESSVHKPMDFQDDLEILRFVNDSRKLLNEVIDKKIKLITIHAKVITSSKPTEENKPEVHNLPTLTQDDIINLRKTVLDEMQKDNTYTLK